MTKKELKKFKQQRYSIISDVIDELQALDFIVYQHNPYVIRLYAPHLSKDIYDWYFGTGKLVKNKWYSLKEEFWEVKDILKLF